MPTEIKERLFLFYQCCERAYWQDDLIQPPREDPNCNLEEIKARARRYARRYKRITPPALELHIHRVQEMYAFSQFYHQLKATETKEEYCTLCQGSGYTVSEIRKKVDEYAYDSLHSTSYSEYQKQKEEMLRVFTPYFEFIKQQKETARNQKSTADKANRAEMEHQELKGATTLIEQYIQSPAENKTEFCKETGLDKVTLDHAIDIVRKWNNELYQTYTKKIKQQAQHRTFILYQTIQKIIRSLKTGMATEKERRAFDVLDYYSITSFSIHTLLEPAKKILTPQEYQQFKAFSQRLENMKPYTTHQLDYLLGLPSQIDCQKDADDRPIPGTGRTFTREEKQSILDYLKTQNIPITNVTYATAITRYLKGTLELNTKEEPTVQKKKRIQKN